MLLITVEAAVEPSDLDAAIALVETQAPTVRTLPGCAHYAVYRAQEPAQLAIVQQWTDMAAFDAYRSSTMFATLGQGLKPSMTAAPVTRIAEIPSV